MSSNAEIAAFERRKRALFEAVLALPDSQRATYLANVARTEPSLADAVRRLITASHAESSGVLNHPVHERRQSAMPSSIANYAVLKHLGDGGMGSVYLCQQPGASSPVAVKIIRASMQSSTVRAHFARERDVLKELNHPNVCRLLDAGVAEGGTPFIVMELVQGEHIGAYCQRLACSLERRLLLFSQVLAGVEYFHSRHVIHRDLKPSNLFVTAGGSIKILDFGLAKMIEHEKGHTGVGPTGTHSRFMTIAYASPEQLTGRLSGRASDIYTLGVICYELLTGRHPFPRESRQTAQTLYETICSHAPALPSQKVPGLPPAIDNMVMKALQPEAKDRHDSAATFLNDLRKCLEVLETRALRASR